MNAVQNKQELIDFLHRIQRPDYLREGVEETSILVVSGLIDFADRCINPGDLRLVQPILALIARESST